MKQIFFPSILMLLLASAVVAAEAPAAEFTYVPAHQVVYWAPPEGFGEVASWAPPPEFAWTEKPWTPPPGYPVPSRAWEAPKEFTEPPENWAPPEEIK